MNRLRIQEGQIVAGTHSINSLLDKLEMYPSRLIWGEPTPTYYESLWMRVESGGILFSEMDLGDRVATGDVTWRRQIRLPITALS